MSTEDLSINDESSYAASTEYAVPEAESDENNTNRGRKRRAEGDASSNGALAHKKEEEEETSGKRVRKKNRMYDDDYSMGGEKASSKSKRDVLLSPDQVREKEKALPKGYAYTLVPVEDPPKASLVTSGKRERKRRVDADFVENNTKPLPVKKTTIPASGSKRTKSSDDTENGEAYVTPKNPKKTKSEQSRQAKLESTLTALNDQLALVSQSIQKNKGKVKTEPSSTPVQAVASPPSAAAPYPEDPEEMENGVDHDMEEAYTPIAPKSSASKARKTRSSEAGSSHGRRTPRSEHPSPSPSSTKTSSGGRSHRAIKRRASSPGEISGALSKCEKIISDLLKHPDSWPFRKPVDPVKLHIPDYFDIIKRPMDLGTVKNQLRAGQYLTPDDLAEDVRLVFWNTRTYNPPTDDVVAMANNLESIFEEKFKAAIKEDVFDEDGTSLKDKVNQLSKNLLSAKEEIKKWKEKATAPAPATSPGLVAASTPSKPKGRTPKEDNRVMTFDEKRRLSMNINKLPAEKLGKVIQIIHERSPKLAQSSAPDEIEIDIDALDTVTLRCLERYAKSVLTRERKSSAGASLSRKQQVDITASGTQEKIRDVERQLNELNRSLEAKTPGRRGGKKKGGDRDEDVVIDDNAPLENYPSVHIEKDSADHSDSGSDSESSSGSSDSESSSSDSDSDSSTSSASSDSENKTNGGSSSKKRSLQKDLAPGGQTTQHHPTSRPAITNTDQSQPTPTNNYASPPLSAPPPTSPPMQLHQEKVIFTLEKPVHTPPTAENTEVAPEIKQSTSTKKAPELPTTVMASWTSLLDTSSASSTPVPQQSTPPTDPMWSQFQNKNIQQKQKEKEREEQEELLRREREEREEEKKREEERKRREAEEAELKRQRDTEAENEQKKQALLAQRAAARAAREMIVGKNMTEQSNLMASFENETRSQQASLLDLHLKPVDVKNSSDVPPSKPTEPEEGEL